MASSHSSLLQSLAQSKADLTPRPRKKRRLDRPVALESSPSPEPTEPHPRRPTRSTLDDRSSMEPSESSTENDLDTELSETSQDAELGVKDGAGNSKIEEGHGEEDEDAIDGSSDPYERRLNRPTERLKLQIAAIEARQWHRRKRDVGDLGHLDEYSLEEIVPTISQKFVALEDLTLIKRLGDVVREKRVPLSQSVSELTPSLFGYRDVLHSRRSVQNSNQLRQLTCLHLLNHVYKTRRRVLRNNARKSEQAPEIATPQDQGFTRPKILIMIPTREACVRWVDTLYSLSSAESQENKDRFHKSFHNSEETTFKDRTQDFIELFGGNDDDNFKIGLKFTRKTMKLFAPFYSSDIILASPLGLRMAMGDPSSKHSDYDFLSSVEVLVIDQADALLMQNWEHLQQIVECTNLQPKEAHDCDFSRVREWYLDGHARFLRQTLVYSAFLTPEINALFTKHMQNVDGKLKVTPVTERGAIMDLDIHHQTFFRLARTIAQDEADQRFEHFTSVVLPALLQPADGSSFDGGILLFVPSYFEFVRIRNYLQILSTKQELQFGSISEYTPQKEITRTRSHFFYGRYSMLLYTERAHHFHRYLIRGVKTVSMYGLPANPVFYREIAGDNLMKSIEEGKVTASEASVFSLFSRWDALKLERIVGTERVAALLKEKGDTFEFV